MSVEALSGKTFMIITGASRGIGRQIAITFGSLLQKGSHILLLARDINALREVAKNIPSTVSVDTVSIDLAKSTKDDLEGTILRSLKGITPGTFERMVMVHNVGIFGEIMYVNNAMELDAWRKIYDINVFVPFILNAVAMKVFNDCTKKLVINITTLFAIQPQHECGYYCSAKAAREMYFKVFALENPDVDVLSYSPGPVDTDMFTYISTNLANTETRNNIMEVVEKKAILTTEQTVNRLVEVLKIHKYKSADHVDYYDEL